MEKKIDLRRIMQEMAEHKVSIFEMQGRFRENFFYLLDFEVTPADLQKIEKFELFLRDRLQDLATAKVKLNKLPTDYPLTEAKVNFLPTATPLPMMTSKNNKEVPGKTSTATYESVTYSLKMVAETLGIDNKEFTCFQAAPISMRLTQMKNSIHLIIEFLNE